jgi:hypothetical protein
VRSNAACKSSFVGHYTVLQQVFVNNLANGRVVHMADIGEKVVRHMAIKSPKNVIGRRAKRVKIV